MDKSESESLMPTSMPTEPTVRSTVERQPGGLVWVYLTAYGNCVGRASEAD